MFESKKFISFLMTIIFAIMIPGCLHKSETKKSANTEQQGQTEENRKRKYFRDLTYNELRTNKERLVAEGKKETAINHLEKMIPLCNNIQELRDMTLEMEIGRAHV